MQTTNLKAGTRSWTAQELRALPCDQRDAILSAAAALAEDDYRGDAQLTAFEAFGEGDLHGGSSDARDQTR